MRFNAGERWSVMRPWVASDMTNHYPEIGRFGSLAKVLRKSLAAPDLQIRGFNETIKGSRFWATVKNSSRSSDVCTALESRCFIAPLWHLGVRLASIETAVLADLVQVLRAWFVENTSATELGAVCPRVSVGSLASAYDAGPEHYVEAVWQSYLGERPPNVRHSSVADRSEELIRAASKHPTLRALLPFTSMTTLCFSQTTGFPFLTDDTPRIEVDSSGLLLVVPQSGERIRATTVEQAAAAAAALIPAGVVARHGRAA